MKITYEEMKDIAKTLPIGYYLGRKVEVIIDPSGGAYADIIKGIVHVGFDIMKVAADNIDAADAAKWDREKLLRCVLYHEVGHILLTHDDLGYRAMSAERYVNSKARTWYSSLSSRQRHAIMNIFEDERLECVLASVFMGVDFKAFCRLVNKNATASKDPIYEFLDVVRLRKTTPEISARIDDIIQKYAEICAGLNCDAKLVYYVKDVFEFAYDIIGKPKPKEEPKTEPKTEPTPGDDGAESKDPPPPENGGKGDDESDDGCEDESEGDREDEGEDEEDESKDGECGDSSEDGGGEDGIAPRTVSLPPDLMSKAASALFVEPTNEVQEKFSQLARRLAKKRGTQAAGCYSALHGKINVKRDAMGKDRIFRRPSDVGDAINRGTNITLWIDVSGSFYESVPVLNRILVAANRITKIDSNIRVNLVKMNTMARISGPNEWEIRAGGGNCIGKSYLESWKKTRDKSRRNIDVVVFDGDAKSDCLSVSEKVPGKDIESLIWNHPDCHIITDAYNKRYFDKLNNAHVTYCKSEYAELLETEFLKIVDRIM